MKHELARAHIAVVKALGEHLPPLTLDPHQIAQVFVNLFMNAIHAMPDGGTLTVRTTARQITELAPDLGRRTSDPFGPGDTVVVVEIEDTDSGIPPEKLNRVFDPFFTTKPSGEGTGLGLSVTRTGGGRSDAEETDSAL